MKEINIFPSLYSFSSTIEEFTNKSYSAELYRTVWSPQNKTLKAAILVILAGKYTSPTHLNYSIEILKSDDLYKAYLSKFVHKHISKIFPQYFGENVTEFKNDIIHETTEVRPLIIIYVIFLFN